MVGAKSRLRRERNREKSKGGVSRRSRETERREKGGDVSVGRRRRRSGLRVHIHSSKGFGPGVRSSGGMLPLARSSHALVNRRSI